MLSLCHKKSKNKNNYLASTRMNSSICLIFSGCLRDVYWAYWCCLESVQRVSIYNNRIPPPPTHSVLRPPLLLVLDPFNEENVSGWVGRKARLLSKGGRRDFTFSTHFFCFQSRKSVNEMSRVEYIGTKCLL